MNLQAYVHCSCCGITFTANSISVYRPQFGSLYTIRQFPFGPANPVTTSLRLAKLLYNGKQVRTYRYDQQGRLAKRTD